MKKLAPLMIGAALVLSLTGCETFLGGSSSSKAATCGPQTTQYDCTDVTSFTVTRDSKTPDQAVLVRDGQKYEMIKVSKTNGIDKLQHTSGLTYVGASNQSSLVNFKQGKNIAAECRSPEQKVVQKELDEKARDRYATLTDDEIIELLVNRKWYYTIGTGINELYAAISHQLADRIIELSKRYENTLPDLMKQTTDYEAKVKSHLERMGYKW